jgi:hypothetical protein
MANIRDRRPGVGTRAVFERWCRWTSFESLSFPFSTTGRQKFHRIPAIPADSHWCGEPITSCTCKVAAAVKRSPRRTGFFFVDCGGRSE